MPLPPLKNPGKPAERIWGCFKGIAAILLLFSSLLFFNGLQVLSLVFLLFSPALFRKVNRELADLWWSWTDRYAEHFYGNEIRFTGHDVPYGENAFLLTNHQEMSDITVLFRLARRKGRLGDMKWFVKRELKYFPGIGWGMQFLDCLFIKRNWTEDKSGIQKVFHKVLVNRIPLWLVTFPEGTRFREEKARKSREFAKKSGLRPLDHLLIPRTKGFVTTVENLRGHLDAVYDVTIGYIDGVPTLWQWARGYVKQVNVHVHRFSMDELPVGEEALTAWLHDLYVKKDQLLNRYYREGAFPENVEKF